jgi:hypothetical protein
MVEAEEKRQPVQWGAVAAILEDFLTWTQENRAPKTHSRYRDFLRTILRFVSFVSWSTQPFVRTPRTQLFSLEQPFRFHRGCATAAGLPAFSPAL